MDRLPDEILEEILNYAMMNQHPFCIQEYFHGRNIETDHDLQRVHPSQKQHLLDWSLVVGTCKRFRRIGKEAFFSQKVFVMDACFMGSLQDLQPGFLTTQDQYTATQHITSIILIDNIFLNDQDEPKWNRSELQWHETVQAAVHSRSKVPALPSYLYLRSQILAFPRLERFDHLFGYRKDKGPELIIRAAQDRRRPWSHFIRQLASIGTPTEKLDIGIMKCEGPTWRGLKNAWYWNPRDMLDALAVAKEIREGARA